MLVSLTRVGAARQCLTMGLMVASAAPEDVRRTLEAKTAAFPSPYVWDADRPGRVDVDLPPMWLGTPTARDEAVGVVVRAVRRLAQAANAHGGLVLPPGVLPGPDAQAVPAGDVHRLGAEGDAELEVLCNLLRRHAAVLIALAGRGVVGPGRPPDRVGSRWLADSREHLAARYIGSAVPDHLDRVRAQLRRDDGIAHLERMDVAPLPGGHGAPGAALVRCLDAQASPADLRALMVLLAAVGLRARRMARGGRRDGGMPQRLVERNRARAVAEGLRGRFEAKADDRPHRGGRPGGGQGGKDGRGSQDGRGIQGGRGSQGGGNAAPARPVPTVTVQSARDAARALLTDLVPEFVNLGATAEELAPLILEVELPPLGVRPARTQDLLAELADRDPVGFATIAQGMLCDPVAGGPLLARLRTSHPGRVALVLEAFQTRLDREAAGERTSR